MIKSISFKNYKSFNYGTIKICPITVLLGANSVGKSSIIQLLLMLQQTALSTTYKSALRLNGEYISLGENENIFKDKDLNKDLIISFKFKDKNLYNSFKNEYYDIYINSLVRPLYLILNYSLFRKNKEFSNNFKNTITKIKKRTKILNKTNIKKNDFFLLIDILNEISDKIDPSELENFDQEMFFLFDIDYSKYSDSIMNPLRNKNNYGRLFDFLTEAKQKVNTDIFELIFTIKNFKYRNENLLKVVQIQLCNNDNCILKILLHFDKKKRLYYDLDLTSDFLKEKNLIDDHAKSLILKSIKHNATIFYLIASPDERKFFSEKNLNSSLISIILDIFSTSINIIKNSFGREKINYVSPLRAHPQRYYFLDKSKINLFLDSIDGESLTEILKENKLIKKKVNSWLKKFELSVDVSPLKDVIHKLKVNQYGLSLDITDVGFGISQVLPVIVQGFLSYNDSLTIIEQPEIHLHPSMQADLADLFIDIVLSIRNKKPIKYLLIETHSEYLLKRLRRRLAEKRIDKDNVKVYFLYHNDEINSGVIEEKEISKTGSFEWPQNFYAGELLKDTIEFIKHQDY